MTCSVLNILCYYWGWTSNYLILNHFIILIKCAVVLKIRFPITVYPKITRVYMLFPDQRKTEYSFTLHGTKGYGDSAITDLLAFLCHIVYWANVLSTSKTKGIPLPSLHSMSGKEFRAPADWDKQLGEKWINDSHLKDAFPSSAIIHCSASACMSFQSITPDWGHELKQEKVFMSKWPAGEYLKVT